MEERLDLNLWWEALADKPQDPEKRAYWLAQAERHLRHLAAEIAASVTCQPDASWPLGDRIQSAQAAQVDYRRIAYLGKPGSYSHAMALRLFPYGELTGGVDFSTLCARVAEGEADAAVLPIDNSTAGIISDTYDLLLQHGLSITDSASASIRHCLLGVPGTDLDGVKLVVSHPQPLMQCTKYIRRMGWATEAVGSTAAAAELVAKRKDTAVVAIGARESAVLHGLEVLKENIGDSATNQTRFVVAARDLVIRPEAERVSIVFTTPHVCGALAHVLGVFADFGLNLEKIQSRPIPQKNWEYFFYMDFSAKPGDPAALAALQLLSRELPMLRLLGWY